MKAYLIIITASILMALGCKTVQTEKFDNPSSASLPSGEKEMGDLCI